MNWITHEPEEQYHEQSQSGKYMSSHMLADFRRSPLLYRKKVLGQVEESRSSAFVFGSAAHKLILEGREAFDKDYVVSDGPINPKTGESYGKLTKAYAEWAATQEREVVSGDDFSQIQAFNFSVHQNLEAERLLSKGEAECVVRVAYNEVPCQIRIDWFNPDLGIVDYKTTAELRYFESDARRFGYVHQMAFYREVVRLVSGVVYPVHIVATEKCEPFSTGVWLLTSEVLDQAKLANDAAIERFKSCVLNNLWPTGYETERIIDNL